MEWTPEEKAVLRKLQQAGGHARAKKLTKKRRVEIAKQAARARWSRQAVKDAAS